MISVLCPTRGRPKNIINLFRNVMSTAKNAELIFALDADDIPSLEAVSRLPVKYKVSERKPDLASRYNEIYKVASGDIIMIGADDITFETMGWDEVIEREFKAVRDNILLAYADDGHFHGEFATHPFIHRRWVEYIGYLMPEGMSRHLDRWLWQLATTAERVRYIPSVIIRHPFVNRNFDQTLTELEKKIHNDDNVYNSKAAERARDAKRLSYLTTIKFL